MDRAKEDKTSAGQSGNNLSAMLLIGVPILYLALLGPAALLYENSPDTVQNVIELIYAPLEWVDERIPGQPLSQYVKMWIQ